VAVVVVGAIKVVAVPITAQDQCHKGPMVVEAVCQEVVVVDYWEVGVDQ
jgi:hypothetical protein